MPISSPAFWFVVPAAGSGSRMQSVTPKQYLCLANKTVLDQTLSRLLSVTDFAGIVVALSANDQDFSQSLFASHPKIHRVVGGQERSDSVLAALEFLENKIAQDDWVLVHDAARPCISVESINELIQSLIDDPVGGILAIPVADTLKRSNPQQEIIETLDRRSLWQAQTPQMFRYGVLLSSLKKDRANQQTVTDEASAIELAGLSAKILAGRTDNIKITRPTDLDLAEFILQKQNSSGH
jgi:2-C-methyl-D-erythritol 4-phosphate cytidylyltransferase